MAQLGRALRSGRRGRVFESRHSDFLLRDRKALIMGFAVFSFYLCTGKVRDETDKCKAVEVCDKP